MLSGVLPNPNWSAIPNKAPRINATIALLARLQPFLDKTTSPASRAIKTIRLRTIRFFLTNQLCPNNDFLTATTVWQKIKALPGGFLPQNDPV